MNKDFSPKKEDNMFEFSPERKSIKEEPEQQDIKQQINNDSFRFSRSRSNSYNNNNNKKSEGKSFVIKNGCCKECMKAFSKTGKSCLCQVPRRERKFSLSEKGCNFCGCKGCNPIDVNKEKRREEKNILMNDKNIMYKRQRIIDSDDEEIEVHVKEHDDYNRIRKDIEYFMEDFFKYVNFAGIGTPKRSPSYILGYNPRYSHGMGERRRRYKD
jgi:hypothetical protein